LLRVDWEQLDIEALFGSILTREDCCIPAARALWGILKGPVPVDQLVVNSCRNASCVNPAHHALGRRQEVVNNQLKNGRVPKGDMLRQATMSDALAKAIYDEYHSGEATQVELAETHGIKLQTVRSLCLGRTWNSVTGAAKKTWSRDSARRIVRAKRPRDRFIEEQ
jgi:hypothetical protein